MFLYLIIIIIIIIFLLILFIYFGRNLRAQNGSLAPSEAQRAEPGDGPQPPHLQARRDTGTDVGTRGLRFPRMHAQSRGKRINRKKKKKKAIAIPRLQPDISEKKRGRLPIAGRRFRGFSPSRSPALRGEVRPDLSPDGAGAALAMVLHCRRSAPALPPRSGPRLQR